MTLNTQNWCFLTKIAFDAILSFSKNRMLLSEINLYLDVTHVLGGNGLFLHAVASLRVGTKKN